MNSQKKIAVVAAVLTTRDMQRFFVAERSDGLGWEFPGGKLDPGEEPRAALRREILEELGCEVDVQSLLGQSEVLVNERIITMDAYLTFCDPTTLVLKEHLAGEWITTNEVYDFHWAPADIPLLQDVIRYFESKSPQSNSLDTPSKESNIKIK